MTPSSNFMEIIMKDINIRDLVGYGTDPEKFNEEFWKWLLDNYLTKERLGEFFLEDKTACDGVDLASEIFSKYAPTTHRQELLTYICDTLYLLPEKKLKMRQIWQDIAEATLAKHKKNGEEVLRASDYKEVQFIAPKARAIEVNAPPAFLLLRSDYATNLFVNSYGGCTFATLRNNRSTIFSYPSIEGVDYTFHSHCQHLILMGNENIVKAMGVQNIVVCSGNRNTIDFYNDGNQLYCYGDNCIISNKLSDLSAVAKSKIYVYGDGCYINLVEPVKYLYVAPGNTVTLGGKPLELPVKTFLVWKDGGYVPE